MIRRVRQIVRRVPVDQEVDEELAFHVEMRTRQLIQRGMAPEAARAAAVARFGDIARVNRTCRRIGKGREREMKLAESFDTMRQDVAFAARQLRRSPGFALVAALTLALGIGATAAIFSVVDAVVLRRLPFPEQDRIVRVRATSRGREQSVAPASFVAWREQNKVFSHLAARVQTGFVLGGREIPELVAGAKVSPDYFQVFGMTPQVGRGFLPEEESPGHDHVAMLSARAWAKYFHAERAAVGRQIQLNGESYTVVGVMPPAFDITAESDAVWVPLAFTPDERARHSGYLEVYGRLEPDASLDAARSAMRAVETRLAARDEEQRGLGVAIRPFATELSADYKPGLFTLLGAVGFVLLIGCANVANLLIARGMARAKEMAIRTALGAGRARIVRQLLTESLLLALVGGAAGLALARWGIVALVAISPEGVPRLERAHVDLRTLGFTLALTVASALLFGLVPALRATRRDLQASLREGGRGDAVGASRDRLRGLLVVAEVALSLVLLTGAGLLVRSAVLLQRVNPGFSPAGVLTARVMLPEKGYADATRVVQTFARIAEEVRRTPGTRSVGLVLMVPLSDDDASGSVAAEGGPRTKDDAIPAAFRIASPGYFETMRIPVRRGRDFTDRDTPSTTHVAIVNETLSRRLWPGESAVGKRFTGPAATPANPDWLEVVGVVGDVRGQALGKPPRPEFYIPVTQAPAPVWSVLQRSLVVVARGTGPLAARKKALERAVAKVDANLPAVDVASMDEYIEASMATGRFSTLLLGALSAIGLILATVGIYGVIAYFVAQRTQEIGVRMALGATPRRVLALVVRRGMGPVALGVVLGAGASAALTQVLDSLLYGITPTDPVTFGAVIAVLVGAALLATIIPARRATRVDPAKVLQGA